MITVLLVHELDVPDCQVLVGLCDDHTNRLKRATWVRIDELVGFSSCMDCEACALIGGQARKRPASSRVGGSLGTAATAASKRTASDVRAGPPVTTVPQPAATSVGFHDCSGSSRCVRIRSIRVVNSTPPVWTSLPNRSVRRAFSNRCSSPRKE